MAQNRIRWKKGDLISLGKAVAQFNKKKKQLENLLPKDAFPEEVSYSILKEQILTRKELNRVLKSLKSFKTEGAEDIVTLESGQEVTRWEFKELQKEKKQAINQLTKELAKWNEPTESGFSRAQMGANEPKEIKWTIESIKNLEKKKGSEFKRVKSRVKTYSRADYEYRRALIYQKNYLQMLEKDYSNYYGYNSFMKKLLSIRDPFEFYNFLQQNEKLMDIKFMYSVAEEGIASLDDEDAFLYLLEDLGIDIDEELEEEENIEIPKIRRYRYFVIKNNEIVYSTDERVKAINKCQELGNCYVVNEEFEIIYRSIE